MGYNDNRRYFYQNWDSRNITLEETKKEYIENEGLDYEPTDSEIYDYIARIEEDGYFYAKNQLEKYLKPNRLLCIAQVQTWQGQFDGGFIADSFEDLVSRFCGRSADSYAEFWEEGNGELHISSSHHDGTNEARIYLITDKGWDYIDDNLYNYDLDERELHENLIKQNMVKDPYPSKAF